MQRLSLSPRTNWQQGRILRSHLPYSARAEPHYWDESACYEFTAAEIDTLEAAGNTLQEMCLAAAQHVIDKSATPISHIPEAAIPVIEWAWKRAARTLRPLRLPGPDASGQSPKLLEYNADTPTSLLEAAVIQWYWLEEMKRFLAARSPITPTSSTPSTSGSSPSGRTSTPTSEARLLRRPTSPKTSSPSPTSRHSAAGRPRHPAISWSRSAGTRSAAASSIPTKTASLHLQALPLGDDDRRGVRPAAPRHLPSEMRWIEPIWKLLLSNKGILPILWELYPNHQLLLEAHFACHVL